MKYVAFFRGINVGGKNIVKMPELARMFADLGFDGVKTYIQSGNAVFSLDAEQSLLAPLIEQNFKERFGFASAVVIRSGAEIINIINSLPFSEEEIKRAQNNDPDVEHIYVYLSEDVVNVEEINRLCAPYVGEDRYHVTNREIYLLCFNSIRDSKLAAALTKLPRPPTSRNLKTIRKISLML